MENREELTAKAFACLYREGFHATGVERLAQQMGVTKRTLYSHFESKDGLISAVLDYRHAQFMAQMNAALNGKDATEIPQAYLSFIEAWTASPEFHGCLFINACAEYPDPLSPAHQSAQAHKQAIRDTLRQTIGKTRADLLFMLGEGLIVAAQTGQQFSKETQQSMLNMVL